MRIRTLTLALAVLALTAGRGEAWEKGVRAGLDLATFRGDFSELLDLKGKFGFTGGAFVAFPVSRMVAIQPEALFVMKGAKTVVEGTDPSGNPTGAEDIFWDLSYLEIPVLLRVSPIPEAAMQPRLFLGPNFGISLGGRFHSNFGSEDITDLKAVDVGATGGVGVRTALGGRGVTADLRYTTGFGDLFDVDGNIAPINSVFSLTVGVEF